ncbi:MAG: tetratricopeptide repeat protein [Acidobacteria bacterium]|nr:tetratricopeptide repeat protein [Acidobacteriota bacterium]
MVSGIDRSPYAIGDFHRQVTTQSSDAQLWFDRGLALVFAFNHEEAIACFSRALEADPQCAMAHWGIAYASGPNINNVEMDETARARATEHVQKASALKGAPVEMALIHAIGTRYGLDDQQEPRNRAYADAMRQVAANYPNDADVTALFAESLMILRPWKHWTPEGQMAPETPEIIGTLEAGLSKWPKHVALCHYYIHAMEASPHPEKAMPAANVLRDAMPGAGHLLHMPAHIDVLVGNYQDSIIANQKGLEADRAFVTMRGDLNFYTLYRLHNYHFIVYSAMFDGQRALALEAAEAIIVPQPLLDQMADFVEAFLATRLHVFIRFGNWDTILAEPEPPSDHFMSRAVWRHARTLAFAATRRVDEADAERALFQAAVEAIPESRLLFNNSCKDVMGVASAMVDGEIAYRKGQFEDAFRHLREAVSRDDALNYDEPWGWMQPARHALGALLLEQGKIEEAESVYLADLKRHPKNVWALHGLAECTERKGKDATAVKDQLKKACSRADVPITTSCYCRIGTKD